MEKQPVARIKQLLPNLTSSELREVINLSKLFLKGKPAEDVGTNVELLYEAVMKELASRYKCTRKPLYIVLNERGAAYDRLLAASDHIDTWIAEAMPQYRMSRLQRHKLYAIFAGLVVDALEQTTIPVNIETVLSYFSRLPSIVDRAFPGYAQSGVLHTILLWGGQE